MLDHINQGGNKLYCSRLKEATSFRSGGSLEVAQ